MVFILRRFSEQEASEGLAHDLLNWNAYERKL